MGKILNIFCGLTILLFLSACGQEELPPEEEEPEAKTVQIQSVRESQTVSGFFEYPATVLAEEQAEIVSRASGTISGILFDLGESVRTGEILLKIDSKDGNPIRTAYENALNAVRNARETTSNQIRSAAYAAEQAETSWNSARENFEHLLASSAKDLEQSSIAREQAQRQEENVRASTAETFRSAELGLENAQIALEQALLNLENRSSLLSQSERDLRENTEVAVTSAADTLETIIFSLNTTFGFFDPDDIYDIPEFFFFGSLESGTRGNAIAAFQSAWELLRTYQKKEFVNLTEKIQATLDLAREVKILVDAVKTMLDHSIPELFPRFGEYQALVNQYQNQINALLLQLQTTAQNFASLDLNNLTTLDNLEKTHELAQQQEKIARQNLENVRTTNQSQIDQASFAVRTSETQYESLRIKQKSQTETARSQRDIAEIQYRNALTSLENARDAEETQLDALNGQLELARIQLENLEPVAPIDGKVSTLNVSEGDTVSPGQPLMTVSQTEVVKLQFYIDPEFSTAVHRGQEVDILTGNSVLPGAISRIAPEADPVTKRFLIEVLPAEKGRSAEEQMLLSGTVVRIRVEIRQTSEDPDALLVPLSALSVSPSESFVFVMADGKARKIPVEVLGVKGETAEIKGTFSEDEPIIIEGNKLLQDGDPVIVIVPEDRSEENEAPSLLFP